MSDSAPVAAIAAVSSAWEVPSQKAQSGEMAPIKTGGAAKDAADAIGAWSAVKAVSAVGMADVAAEWAAAVSARALAVIWGAKASHEVAS
ncbi:hypothetical protein GOX01_06000 [Gluconobacter oxydans]|nr:hypothetical protein GOX01_06000 [Gluconobacter oxydans]